MRLEIEILDITLRAIIISGGATFLACFWGLPLGIGLGLKKFHGRSFVKVFFSAMMGMPTVSLGLFLYLIFSRSGPLGFLHLLYTPLAIMFGQAVLITPIIVSFVSNTVESVDPEIRDLAKTLGASETQVSIAILNESRRGIILSVISSFNRAISELGVALMIGGNLRGLTRVLTTTIALSTTKAEITMGISLTIILLITVFALNFLVNFIQKRV
jgi:tungstate transport system permease protein